MVSFSMTLLPQACVHMRGSLDRTWVFISILSFREELFRYICNLVTLLEERERQRHNRAALRGNDVVDNDVGDVAIGVGLRGVEGIVDEEGVVRGQGRRKEDEVRAVPG